VSLLQEAERASKPRSGLVRKISPYRSLNTGFLTRSQSLYLLRYPGRQFRYGLVVVLGARGSAVVEALRYKPEGRGIDSQWCHWKILFI
jgi:hypothetical protein